MPATDSASSCPNCGLRVVDPGGPSCPRCGVVFAKLATSRKLTKPSEIVVTTGDLHEDYTILGPVFFSVSNKGHASAWAGLQWSSKRSITVQPGSRIGHFEVLGLIGSGRRDEVRRAR